MGSHGQGSRTSLSRSASLTNNSERVRTRVAEQPTKVTQAIRPRRATVTLCDLRTIGSLQNRILYGLEKHRQLRPRSRWSGSG
jgi:hypothetical protein